MAIIPSPMNSRNGRVASASTGPGFDDFVRMTLGAVLLLAAFLLLARLEAFSDVLRTGGFPMAGFALAHGVVLVHLAGGALLVAGLHSRWAAFFQLPILVAALMLANFDTGVLSVSSLGITVATALMAAWVMVRGDGRWSLAASFRTIDAEQGAGSSLRG